MQILEHLHWKKWGLWRKIHFKIHFSDTYLQYKMQNKKYRWFSFDSPSLNIQFLCHFYLMVMQTGAMQLKSIPVNSTFPHVLWYPCVTSTYQWFFLLKTESQIYKDKWQVYKRFIAKKYLELKNSWKWNSRILQHTQTPLSRNNLFRNCFYFKYLKVHFKLLLF